MALGRYELPDTYEEAVARKEEVLQKINEYNEALFSEAPLPFSEEELDDLQEEFQILNDRLRLTEKEKLQKLDESQLEEIDGELVEKKTFWDKIHWAVYIYGLLSTIFATGILNKSIGDELTYRFIVNYFVKTYKACESMYMTGEYMISGFHFWFVTILTYVFLPILICLLSLGVYFIFRNKGEVNRKVTFYLLIAHICLAVIVITLLIVLVAVPTWKDYYKNFQSVYSYWVYSNLSGY